MSRAFVKGKALIRSLVIDHANSITTSTAHTAENYNFREDLSLKTEEKELTVTHELAQYFPHTLLFITILQNNLSLDSTDF